LRISVLHVDVDIGGLVDRWWRRHIVGLIVRGGGQLNAAVAN